MDSVDSGQYNYRIPTLIFIIIICKILDPYIIIYKYFNVYIMPIAYTPHSQLWKESSSYVLIENQLFSDQHSTQYDNIINYMELKNTNYNVKEKLL